MHGSPLIVAVTTCGLIVIERQLQNAMSVEVLGPL